MSQPTELNCIKVAWIRDQSVPPGRAAKGRLKCACGFAPWTDFDATQGDVRCGCGKLYTWDGHLLEDPYKGMGPVTEGAFSDGEPHEVVATETGRRFMLSILSHDGLYWYAAYEVGEKRPARGMHRLLIAEDRYNWFGRLRLVK